MRGRRTLRAWEHQGYWAGRRGVKRTEDPGGRGLSVFGRLRFPSDRSQRWGRAFDAMTTIPLRRLSSWFFSKTCGRGCRASLLELNGLHPDHGGDPCRPEQQPQSQVSAKPQQALRGRTSTPWGARSHSSSACTSRIPPYTDPGSQETRFRIVVSPVRCDDSGILLDVHAGSSNADGLPIRIAFGHLTRMTQPPGGTARVVGEHHRSAL